jgi:hypothetical protein
MIDAFFRLPAELCKQLRLRKQRRGKKINQLIERYVSRFYQEVVPEHFRLLASQGLDQINESVLRKEREAAWIMGIRFAEKIKRSPIATNMSAETLTKLLVIEKWIGSNRQQALEACLGYGLGIIGKPNPHRGDLMRVLFPPLALSGDMDPWDLQRIVENEIS